MTGQAALGTPSRREQIAAARVVAAADGAARVVDTVRAVLVAGRVPARDAAELAGQLHLAELAPQLRNCLGDRLSRVAAARALARLGTPPADLTAPLVDGISDYHGGSLDVIVELRAVETIPYLEALLASDRRLPFSGFHDDLVWTDERLADRIRATLAALRGT
jgi:hypothetical protein